MANKLIKRFAKYMNKKSRNIEEWEKPARNLKIMYKNRFSQKMMADEWFYNEHQVITLKTKKQKFGHVIFLHGGAYTSEASIWHRFIIETMVEKYKFKVTFIDYPLYPEYEASYTNKTVIQIYIKLIEKYPKDEFLFFGDSAGGGLALSILQQIRDENLKPIKKTALVSPWVDVSLTNQHISEYKDLDLTLPLKELTILGKNYSGNIDIKDPLVSPIYGTLDNLGEIIIFYGTEELLNPDIKELIKKAETSKNTIITGIEEKNMLHDFILIPMKKSKKTLKRIMIWYNK